MAPYRPPRHSFCLRGGVLRGQIFLIKVYPISASLARGFGKLFFFILRFFPKKEKARRLFLCVYPNRRAKMSDILPRERTYGLFA